MSAVPPEPIAQDPSSATTSDSVPFEAIPALATNADYVAKMDRLRELKHMEDELFNDKESKSKPLGEYHLLKREVAAIQLCHGARSVTYHDLRVSRVPGGVDKGKVNGVQLATSLGTSIRPSVGVREEDVLFLLKVIAAAKDFDPAKLLEAGVPAQAIAAAREPDKPRADSTKVEWVGKIRGGSLQ